jgi:hypothetical protein
MWVRIDSQEVGLEAATLERVRNSSLVEWTCADNVTGLNTPPKPRMPYLYGVVAERRSCCEAAAEAVVERGRVRM